METEMLIPLEKRDFSLEFRQRLEILNIFWNFNTNLEKASEFLDKFKYPFYKKSAEIIILYRSKFIKNLNEKSIKLVYEITENLIKIATNPQTKDYRLVSSIIESLYEREEEKFLKLKQLLLNSRDSLIQRESIKLLGKPGKTENIEILKNLILYKTNSPFLVESSVIALLKINTKESLELINDLSILGSDYIKEGIAKALRVSDTSFTFEILKKLSKEDNFFVRLNVAKSLGERKDEQSFELLKNMLNDENKYVKEEVLDSLGKRSEPQSTEILKDIVLNYKNEEIRKKALTAFRFKPITFEIKKFLDSLKDNKLFKTTVLYVLHFPQDSKINLNITDSFSKETILKNLILHQDTLFFNPQVKSNFIESERKSQFLLMLEVMKDWISRYEEIIGFSILGSYSKGYYNLGSDIDWAMILDRDISEDKKLEFKRKFREELYKKSNYSFPILDEGYIIEKDIKKLSDEKISVLFNGMFIGDRRKYEDFKKFVLKNLSIEKLEQGFKCWIENLESYDKMKLRFGFTDLEIKTIESGKALLYGFLPVF